MAFLALINHENVDGHNVLSSYSAKLLSKIVATGEDIIVVNIDSEYDRDSIQKLGIKEIINCPVPEEYLGLGMPISQVILEAYKQLSEIRGIFLPSNFMGKEVASILAVKFNVAAVSDVQNFYVDGQEILLNKKVLNSTWTTKVKNDSSVCIATLVDDNEVVYKSVSELSVRQLEVDFSNCSRIRVLSSEKTRNSSVDLENASVVVCGGRGTEGDFTPVYDLATKLDGVVGATRVATDEGWVDHDLQIGQTGRNLNAKLYIGLGVSGAIHHTCSLQNCDNIVAICDDEDAPIFEIADFGIVGDLNSVVPILLEELEK